MSHYPFTAVVGQQELKHILLLNLINPQVGGVLIRGEKGNAKSTAARGLASLLPPLKVVYGCPYNCNPDQPEHFCEECRSRPSLETAHKPVPFVELPINATEDRVIGTINIDRTLSSGHKVFEPGMLARANRGILYIDEVNLLDDFIVDSILDAAASGINTVERDSFSVSHPARFMLVGTMNPDEGDVRPQLLDRFGTVVDTGTLEVASERIEVLRRHHAFVHDRAHFMVHWEKQEMQLRERIVRSRERLERIQLTDEMCEAIAGYMIEAGVRTLRADLAVMETARAAAALAGRPAVGHQDVMVAMKFCLPHRIEDPTLFQQVMQQAQQKTDAQQEPSPPTPLETPKKN